LDLAGRESLDGMKLRRIISTQVSREGDGFSVRAAIDAVVAANVNEPAVAHQARTAGEQEVSENDKEAPDE
jgi:hypothetical protein